jgi:hypothetical protein
MIGFRLVMREGEFVSGEGVDTEGEGAKPSE